MKKILGSIYHDSTKNYVSNPYPSKGEKIKITLRLLKNDFITGVFIRYRELGAERIEKMDLDFVKNGLEYYSCHVEVYDPIFSYHFNISSQDTIYYYSQHKLVDYLSDESTNFKILVDYQAPSWMKDQVFYQIMPDRFYNGRPEIGYKQEDFIYQGFRPKNMKWDEIPLEWQESRNLDFYGGDIWGVIEKLDYLQGIGVTGIYFNPIFKSPSMHKYDALDYFQIDETLGGDQALIELSKEMKKRDMKLVLDISINHTSSDSIWFNKDGIFYPKDLGAYNNPNSKERQYYFIEEDGTYDTWAGVKTMPALNYTSQSLRDIIYRDENSVLKKYLKPPYNIDGWRFDVADVMARSRKVDLYYEVWHEINEAIKSVNPHALILAEEWADAPDMFVQGRWDSTMNYFYGARPIREFAGEQDLFTKRNPLLSQVNYKFDASQLAARILQFVDKHPSQITYQMLNLIDSHDVARLHNNSLVDYDIYKGAVMTLFGLPGAVNIYYGDEKYLDGRINSVEGARYPMDWTDVSDLSARKKETYDLYSSLAKLKNKNEALKSGGFKIIHAKEDVFAFVRFAEDKAFIFVWNKGLGEELELDIEFLGLKNTARIILGNGQAILDKSMVLVSLAYQESLVIEVK